ncbi:unnamed protein product [Protopolystoma xenopodis]|uniref:Uncharacterized protein n=1 Tax=Protopolystoma xenopodis TaxID=117903 RepID=A0A3S5CLA2_9PLAT|nr:unnamed protein product [Protopolystoma xenopodis]
MYDGRTLSSFGLEANRALLRSLTCPSLSFCSLPQLKTQPKTPIPHISPFSAAILSHISTTCRVLSCLLRHTHDTFKGFCLPIHSTPLGFGRKPEPNMGCAGRMRASQEEQSA